MKRRKLYPRTHRTFGIVDLRTSWPVPCKHLLWPELFILWPDLLFCNYDLHLEMISWWREFVGWLVHWLVVILWKARLQFLQMFTVSAKFHFTFDFWEIKVKFQGQNHRTENVHIITARPVSRGVRQLHQIWHCCKQYHPQHPGYLAYTVQVLIMCVRVVHVNRCAMMTSYRATSSHKVCVASSQRPRRSLNPSRRAWPPCRL